MLAALLVSMGVLLSGCDSADKTNTTSTAHAQAANEPAVSTEQSEIEKYNVYVDAANRGADFADILEKRKENNPALFDTKKKLTDYYMFSSYDITSLQKKLQTALSMPAAMPELDEPAQGMVAALTKLQPLQAELSNYADSKGYLVDDGKKGKDMEPALDEALKDVAVFQAQFFEGISKRDEVNTRTAFEKAEKGSEAYYRAGIVVYAKESARLAAPFFKSAGSEEASKPFGDSLTKTGEMIEGWSKSGAGGKPPQNCTILLSDFNSFVGKGRAAIAAARSGRYKRDGQSERMWNAMNPIKIDANFFDSAYGKVINGLNSEHCN